MLAFPGCNGVLASDSGSLGISWNGLGMFRDVQGCLETKSSTELPVASTRTMLARSPITICSGTRILAERLKDWDS